MPFRKSPSIDWTETEHLAQGWRKVQARCIEELLEKKAFARETG